MTLSSPASRLWLLESILGESCKIRFSSLLSKDSDDEEAQELALDLCTLVSTLLPVVWRDYSDLKGPLGTRLAVSKLLGLVFYHNEAGLNAQEGRKQAIQYLNAPTAIDAFGETKARQLLGLLALEANTEFLHELKRNYDSIGETLTERMSFYAESLVQQSGTATPKIHRPNELPIAIVGNGIEHSAAISPPKKPKTKDIYSDYVIDGTAFRRSLIRNDDLISNIVHGKHPSVAMFYDEIRSALKHPQYRSSPDKKATISSPSRPLNDRHDSATRVRWTSQEDLDEYHFRTNPSANASSNRSSPSKQPIVHNAGSDFMERNERSSASRRPKPKDGRRFFTEEEQRKLIEGYREYPHQWAAILKAKFLNSPDRTSIDLKDKFRNLFKKGCLPDDVMDLARQYIKI